MCEINTIANAMAVQVLKLTSMDFSNKYSCAHMIFMHKAYNINLPIYITDPFRKLV